MCGNHFYLNFGFLGNFARFFVACCFFSKSTFLIFFFRNTIKVSNSFDPVISAQHFVGPDLGPICLQQTALGGNELRHQGFCI